MKKVALLFGLLLIMVNVFGQSKPHATQAVKKPATQAAPQLLAKRYNDRNASGYSGKVKRVTRVVWKNAADSIRNSKKDFDLYLQQAKQYIQAHYSDFEKVDKKSDPAKLMTAQVSEEEFDAAGNIVREENWDGNDMFNVTYQYSVVNADKRQISGISNRDGKKIWGGYLTWTESNKRVQELAMGDQFTLNAQITLFDSLSRSTKSSLKLKDLFVMEVELNRLSQEHDKEIWVHVEISKDIRYDTLSPVIDTITHIILARDTHDNVIREIVSHSKPAQPKQFVKVQYEYY